MGIELVMYNYCIVYVLNYVDIYGIESKFESWGLIYYICIFIILLKNVGGGGGVKIFLLVLMFMIGLYIYSVKILFYYMCYIVKVIYLFMKYFCFFFLRKLYVLFVKVFCIVKDMCFFFVINY